MEPPCCSCDPLTLPGLVQQLLPWPPVVLLQPPPISPTHVYCLPQEPRCRRRALLSYFGERRQGGCAAAGGEALCDFCLDPGEVRRALRTVERRQQQAAVATSKGKETAADPFDRCDPGSGGEEAAVLSANLPRRQSTCTAGSPCGSGEGGNAQRQGPDPFATARALARQGAPPQGRLPRLPGSLNTRQGATCTAAAAAHPRAALACKQSAAAGTAAASSALGSSKARSPLRPLQLQQGEEPAADGSASSVGPSEGPATEPALASQAAHPDSCEALPSGVSATKTPLSKRLAAAGTGGGGKRPVFRAFKPPRRHEQ